jgi:hypothetical protein
MGNLLRSGGKDFFVQCEIGEIVLPKQALVLKIRWFRRCTVCRIFRGMNRINQLPTDVLHCAPISITGWALPAIISLKFLGLDS